MWNYQWSCEKRQSEKVAYLLELSIDCVVIFCAMSVPNVSLGNGYSIPGFGYGTYLVSHWLRRVEIECLTEYIALTYDRLPKVKGSLR